MKKVTVLILTILCAFIITGCFPDGENKSNASIENSEFNSEEIPKTINETLEENLIVDADVIIPTVADWKIIETKLKIWDNKLVENAFLKDKTINEKQEKDSAINKELKDYYYAMKDGSSLVIGPGNVRFYEKKGMDLPYSFFIRGGTPFLDEDIGEKFKKESLDNVNKDQSIELVKDKLKNLGVETIGEPSVHAMDMETLNNNTNFNATPVKGEIHRWEKNEEAYVISFYIQNNSVPITQIGYMTASGFGIGTRIIAVVGERGLLSFELLYAYEPESVVEDNSKIIPLDVVFNTIKEKYKNVLLTDPITINEIRLEYFPIVLDFANLKYKLTPMWVFKANQKTTAEDKKGQREINSNFYILIDAVTGKELEIGGIT